MRPCSCPGGLPPGLAGLLSGFLLCGTQSLASGALGARPGSVAPWLGVFLGLDALSFGFLIFNIGEPIPTSEGCHEA